jgi:hypothetical protein
LEFKIHIEKEFDKLKASIHNKEDPVLSEEHKQWYVDDTILYLLIIRSVFSYPQAGKVYHRHSSVRFCFAQRICGSAG